jgi:hypothetical protein
MRFAPRRHPAGWVAAAGFVFAAGVFAVVAPHHPHAQPATVAAGLRWPAPALPRGWDAANAVVAGGPGFVATGAHGNPISVSADGAHWHRVTSPVLGSLGVQALAAFRGKVYAAGQQCTGGEQDAVNGGCNRLVIVSSEDGSSWSAPVLLPVKPLPQPASSIPYGDWPRVTAITAGPDGLVAVGYQPDGGDFPKRLPRPLAWYSADGKRWKPAMIPAGGPAPHEFGDLTLPAPAGGAAAGRLDGVVAVPGGGYLALEGALTATGTTDGVPMTSGTLATWAGYHGMLYSSDGRRWRAAAAPHVPGRGQVAGGITVGLLYADGNRVLAVGVDAEAAFVYQRRHGEATGRVVDDHPHPIVWQRTPAGGWTLLTAPATMIPGELGTAPPGEAGVEAVIRVGGRLVAFGHVRPGSRTDCAVWSSGDGGASWSEAVHGGLFAGACGDGPAFLAVRGGTVVAAGGAQGLWRAVPVGPQRG